MIKKIYAEMEDSMKKALEKLKGEFMTLRTGRASTTLLDGIKVDYYGNMMPLTQVAGVSTPEARTIEIKPWDPGSLAAIEKAIFSSDIGMTPMNDGKMIRLNMPALTQERRAELGKVVKKVGEEFKVSMRNARRDAIEAVKSSLKEKLISEDDEKAAEHEVQRVTNIYIKKIDDMIAHKEKEIMEI